MLDKATESAIIVYFFMLAVLGFEPILFELYPSPFLN